MNELLVGSTLAFAALTACATVPALPRQVAAISYQTGPCFGACPVYLVSVARDGGGTFLGYEFTAAPGRHSFRATPEQFAAFARHLEPIRPASGSVRYAGETCATMATDLPSVEVTWHASAGEQSLYLYYGCDMERNRALAERLTAAPDLLPVGGLIRRDDER